MTFTYNIASPTDRERVRFHVGDTDSATAIFSDEEIAFVLEMVGQVTDNDGTYKDAVIMLIQRIQTMIAHKPDTKADWLSVDWKRSAEHWRVLLAQKRREFNKGFRVVGEGKTTYRQDSAQTEAPDYSTMADLYDDDCRY